MVIEGYCEVSAIKVRIGHNRRVAWAPFKLGLALRKGRGRWSVKQQSTVAGERKADSIGGQSVGERDSKKGS